MKHKKFIKNIFILALPFFLTACSAFFDKDNTLLPTPLVNFTPEFNPRLLWSTKTGSSTDEYLKMNPAMDAVNIYTASSNGVVSAINKTNGHLTWSVNTNYPLIAGPGIGDGILVIASRKGDIIALDSRNGHTLWKAKVAGEIIANPAIGHGVVVIKAIDGHIYGFSTSNGQPVWTFGQVEPNLLLRGSSSPIVHDNSVISGFANGNLVKLNIHDGQHYWQQTIALPEGAFPIERMIDIDADPVLFEHHIYVATYQGKIASLDWNSGQVLWTHDISSYTGMVPDNHAVYISDAKSYVWSFGAYDGLVNWRQLNLQARVVSGPASAGNYVIVGDGQGYLHWLSKQDGHFVARVNVGAPIYATPLVDNNVLYALTSKGSLVAYTTS